MGTTRCPVTLSQGTSLGKASVPPPPHLPLQALAGTSLPAETGESLFFDDPCLKLLCSIFLSWYYHCLRNLCTPGENNCSL